MDKLDIFYLLSGNSSKQFKVMNIIQPGKFQASIMGDIHNSVEGLGSTESGFLLTGFVPSDEAANGSFYQAINASRGAVVTVFNPLVNNLQAHAIDGSYDLMYESDNVLIVNHTASNYTSNINMGFRNGANFNAPSTGLKAIVRDTEFHITTYDKSIIVGQDIEVVELTDEEQAILVFMTKGEPIQANMTLGCYFLGASLVANEISLIRTSMNSYFQKIGLPQYA
jgi:hypothetical protein